MTQAIIEKVHQHIRREIGHTRDLAELNPKAHLRNDYRAHDLDVLQLVMELEDDFGITITDEEVSQFRTVSDVEKVVLAKVGAEEPAQ